MLADPECAVAYAALILTAEFVPVTPEKIQVLLKAAGIEDAEPIWTTLFAKALEGKDVKDILTEVGSKTSEVLGEKEYEKGGDSAGEMEKGMKRVLMMRICAEGLDFLFREGEEGESLGVLKSYVVARKARGSFFHFFPPGTFHNDLPLHTSLLNPIYEAHRLLP
jgi:large subunit ribosomal protein LP1